MKIRIFIIILLFVIPIKIFAKENRILIASTTSTNDTGLLNELNKKFIEKFNIDVHVLSLGTGQAIRTAQDGNVELLLVHHKDSEIEFMNKGYGIERYEIMYNDYILIGPKNDNYKCTNINKKMQFIYDNKKLFISRDDDSGTNKKEIEIWKSMGLETNSFDNWYVKIGQGMGKTLLFTNEKNAYTISDRSTWISFENKNNLKIICQNQPPLFNQYSIILVNPDLNDKLNVENAKKYIQWIISEEAENIVNNFKKNKTQLFFYNYDN